MLPSKTSAETIRIGAKDIFRYDDNSDPEEFLAQALLKVNDIKTKLQDATDKNEEASELGVFRINAKVNKCIEVDKLQNEAIFDIATIQQHVIRLVKSRYDRSYKISDILKKMISDGIKNTNGEIVVLNGKAAEIAKFALETAESCERSEEAINFIENRLDEKDTLDAKQSQQIQENIKDIEQLEKEKQRIQKQLDEKQALDKEQSRNIEQLKEEKREIQKQLDKKHALDKEQSKSIEQLKEEKQKIQEQLDNKRNKIAELEKSINALSSQTGQIASSASNKLPIVFSTIALIASLASLALSVIKFQLGV
ncbi:hypothetical protein BKN38_02640 [Helicobacter sp. CLO-3]|uniref:hypothetical protein n=1 Tax=unclassified Helicobacter TaxID=2593540 RepID=UPI000805B484|nr:MULTISPECIES: hypothetical protein [unclassified Helicobacter]OBV28389.1 hypothetical protein BA723_09565 [Helicobacter sp. CLO-3]OHU84698.1 hypothetical protein BKN38_02640 [Helicobacter sp. CLO-3]